MDEQAVIDATCRWVSFVVIGLNLCPFARRVFVAAKIRYAASQAEDEVGLLDDLATGRRGLVVHGPTKRQVRGLVEARRQSLPANAVRPGRRDARAVSPAGPPFPLAPTPAADPPPNPSTHEKIQVSPQ